MLVRGGQPRQLAIAGGAGLSVSLSQAPADASSWRVRIWANLEQGGRALLGELTTTARADEPSRVVALAGCPGVESWLVEVQGTPGGAVELELGASHEAPALGLVLPQRRWDYYTGVVGAQVIPAGQRVHTMAAQSVAGGTVQVGAGAVIAVPAGGAVQLEPRGALRGPVTLTLAGTDAWLVEVESDS